MKSLTNSFAWLDPIPIPCLIQQLDTEQLVYINPAAFRKLELPKSGWKEAQLTDYFKLSQSGSSGIWYRKGKRYRILEQRVDLGNTRYKQLIVNLIEPPVTQRQLQDAQRMAEVLVHRLRSPLNGVIGFAEMLNKGHDNDQMEWNSLSKGLHTMKDLLDELNRFTEPIEVHPETINTSQLVEKTISELPAKHVRRVETEIISQPIGHKGDPVYLQFILQQLLENAFQASADELDQVQVMLSENTLQVTNTGPSLNQQQRKELFQPFYTTKARHLGLGLTQAWRYADAMGWELYYEEQSKSTSHTFTLRW